MASRRGLALIKQAKAGDVPAQRDLGALYLSGGEGMASNPRAAASWLLKAAQAGDKEAAMLLGESCQIGLFETPDEALPVFTFAANAGSMKARLTLAQWYAGGGQWPTRPVRGLLPLKPCALRLPSGCRRLCECLPCCAKSRA